LARSAGLQLKIGQACELDAQLSGIFETENSAALPVPILDHIIVNIRRDMAAAHEIARRLGFCLTPLGRHTLGTVNRLAMFGTDYLELLGAPPEDAARTDVPDWPEGLAGLVFATNDADAAHAALAAAGAPVLPPLAFSRPVALSEGTREAAFRTVRIERAASPAGRMFFCGHLTRDVVWRDAWRRHPNGVLGIAELVIAARDPGVYARLFASLFGEAAVQRSADGGVRLPAGLAHVSVVTPTALRARFGKAAPDGGGRDAWMAAAVFRVADAARAEAALRAGTVRFARDTAGAILVGPDQALGAAMVFAEGRSGGSA
jgi:hypothetical protein